MRITRRAKPDGIAIFIVLISIAVLAGMTAIFATQMKVETKLAMNSNNEAEMEWLGRSGVELAKYTLGLELSSPGAGQRYDALNQKWAGGEADTNDVLAALSLTDVPLGHGQFSVKITDNERKINLNTSANNQALMTQAMMQIGADPSEIPTIIACIQDWIDRDDETHVNGAESEYYQTLNPPYYPKNGPIDDLSELLLVKGVTADLYWGPNSTNHPPSIFQPRSTDLRNSLLPNTSMISAGLVDIFTPVSSGQININTCSAITLQMLGMDQSSAEHLLSLRQGPDGVDGTADDVPFSNTGEIVNAGLPTQVIQQFLPLLTVRSTTFDVEVDVQVGLSKRRYHALVRRNSARDIQTLTFRWE
jgi:general secretion pathway protein K